MKGYFNQHDVVMGSNPILFVARQGDSSVWIEHVNLSSRLLVSFRICPRRLVARTLVFQAGKGGSIPLGGTIYQEDT